MNKKTVLIVGGILTLVFFPVGIIVLIAGVLMKPSSEELQRQEDEQLKERQTREQIKEEFSKNPIVLSIVDSVVKDFSKDGEIYNDMRCNRWLSYVSVSVQCDGYRYHYSWVGEPAKKDEWVSFRMLGIQTISIDKAKVLEEMIYEALKDRCPYLIYRGRCIEYRANISL